MKTHSWLAAFLTVTACLCSVDAASVAVPNASFESPATPGSFAELPADGSGVFAAWEKFGGFTASYDMATFGGLPANADGSQALTLNGGFAMAFQELADYSASGSADQYWRAGFTYVMTVGVGLRGDNPPAENSMLELRFFYRTADQATANVLGASLITLGLDPVNATTGGGLLTDYTVTHTVETGAPEEGFPVGLWLFAHDGNGDWALDKVRLDATAVPEPAGSLLGLLAAAALLVRRRR